VVEKDILIVQEGCGHCDDAKIILKDRIENGQIEMVDAYSPRGKEYINKYDISATPTILSGEGVNATKCSISPDNKTIKCDNGTEKVL